MRDWGRILVATRLEKQVSARFVQTWTRLLLSGLRPSDGSYSVAGKVAHKALNDIVRRLLTTECDSLLTLDSDADVDADFLERFRTHEAGYDYDILQAFYARRGWPPRAIWMKRDALGNMMEYTLTETDITGPVDVCGTHACLFRRHVFEEMLGDNDPEQFEWFAYPRHKPDSEDAAFSAEAKAAGYKLGATTAVSAGHLCEINVTWDSYQDYLNVTGKTALNARYRELVARVVEFTGEPIDLVQAKISRGSENVRAAYLRDAPTGAEEERAFYASCANGYLYDLVGWNCTPLYDHTLAPLRGIGGQRVLVIGAGLGTEADVMADNNDVDVFELPGTLKDFGMQRLGDRVTWLDGDTLSDALGNDEYDLVVAIDTLEHVHPDEIDDVLTAITYALKTTGAIYVHNNWGDQELYPMHYDHAGLFATWCAVSGFRRNGDFLWERN